MVPSSNWGSWLPTAASPPRVAMLGFTSVPAQGRSSPRMPRGRQLRPLHPRGGSRAGMADTWVQSHRTPCKWPFKGPSQAELWRIEATIRVQCHKSTVRPDHRSASSRSLPVASLLCSICSQLPPNRLETHLIQPNRCKVPYSCNLIKGNLKGAGSSGL